MGSPGAQEGNQVQVEHLYCCGAATEVLKIGETDLQTGARVLFLIIPGNPGVVGFYRTFMWALHKAFQKRIPVWAVSHAGHCVPPDTMDMIQDASSMETGDAFGLDGQINHKLTFLQEHIPRETRLVLIGHSIGCYIVLEMMKRDPDLQVLKAVLLFPTIERMAETPHGRVMTPVLRRLRYAFYLPIFLLSLLPDSIKAALVRLVLGSYPSLDQQVVPATIKLFSVDCAANAMYMASQEMVQVLQRDNKTIRHHLDKLLFYYGGNDHWCPVQYYQDIRNDFPTANIILCARGIRHAFVLDAGPEVASLIAEWIHKDLKDLY